MSRWVPVPDRAPYKDRFAHRSEPSDGPYFEAPLQYFPAIDDGGQLHPGRNPEQLYLSPQAIREWCLLPGSPLVTLSVPEYDDLERRILAAHATIGEMQARIDELEAAPPAVADVGEIVKAIASELDGRYAKKTGPKKPEPEMSRR